MSNIVFKFAVYEMETGNFTDYVPFPKWKFFSGKMKPQYPGTPNV